MKKLIKFIMTMHWRSVNRLGLIKTAMSYFILVVAVLTLAAGLVIVLRDFGGIKSISVFTVEF